MRGEHINIFQTLHSHAALLRMLIVVLFTEVVGGSSLTLPPRAHNS